MILNRITFNSEPSLIRDSNVPLQKQREIINGIRRIFRDTQIRDTSSPSGLPSPSPFDQCPPPNRTGNTRPWGGQLAYRLNK